MWRQNVAFIEPQQPRWMIAPFGSTAGASLPRQKFDNVDKLKQVMMLEWRALLQRFIGHGIGDYEDVVSRSG